MLVGDIITINLIVKLQQNRTKMLLILVIKVKLGRVSLCLNKTETGYMAKTGQDCIPYFSLRWTLK